MSVDQESKRLLFARLLRNLARLSAHPTPDSIHKFRTSSRRVESFLFELVPEPSRNQRKLLKSLKRLRNKAGRIRDLDVQISTLRSMKLSRSPAGKSRLLHSLVEERARRLRKLEKLCDKKAAAELRTRLRRAQKESVVPANLDPLAVGLALFQELGKDGAPLSEKKLHHYRIVGKRARYVVELAGDTPEALSLVAQLKQLQDRIGDWHDWLELSQRAEKSFQEEPNSPLVVALRNLTRAKFRQAVNVLAATQKSLAPSLPAKPPAAAPAAAAAAVA